MNPNPPQHATVVCQKWQCKAHGECNGISPCHWPKSATTQPYNVYVIVRSPGGTVNVGNQLPKRE